MVNIVEKYWALRKGVPEQVKVVAVSKYQPAQLILNLFELTGHTLFGENKAQEMAIKAENLTSIICWHFIGHLQTNKVKLIAPFVSMIQSVDSYKLLKEINKEASKNFRSIDCLLQIYIASEETKFGFSIDEIDEMLKDLTFNQIRNIRICGVMGMATNTDNQIVVRREFGKLHEYFIYLKREYFQKEQYFKEISMGMTDDYQLAIEEGSTMIRIGSGIFGER